MKQFYLYLTLFFVCFACQAKPLQDKSNIETAKTIIEYFNNSEFENIVQQFNETMKSSLSVEQLEQLWTDLENKNGAFQSQQTPETLSAQGYDIVRVPCKFENAVVKLQLTFDKEGKLAGMYILPG